MSSLIGHALTGYAIARMGQSPNLGSGSFPSWRPTRLWQAWLVIAAVLPDIDYPFLWIFDIRLPIRYTHSVGFCISLSILTLAWLKVAGTKGLRARAMQISLAALSHLALDGLVGVHPNPWLWPFSDGIFRLPFGILPSAGKLDLANRFLYLNLMIELGILSPMIWLPWVLTRKSERTRWLGLAAGLAIWLPFLYWGMGLRR